MSSRFLFSPSRIKVPPRVHSPSPVGYDRNPTLLALFGFLRKSWAFVLYLEKYRHFIQIVMLSFFFYNCAGNRLKFLILIEYIA